ncbi:hypothetical protein AC625_04920 [Peribacillus loiseleuriae]|uniref:Uncharacterized protein n=1 Tax=Peribacillus loiseleuriae TaxID=1679170 RepID=A0A0K9H048_9BACI|nr:hypothetical protein AC625_04920 [Peribacillus loiseleuriae]
MGIVLFLTLTAFSINHTFPRSFHHTFTKTTDLSKENIEGLYLNDNFYSDEITKKYGKKTEQSRDVTGYDYYELRKGIEVATNKSGKITRFIITDRNLETVKGIKIGDNKEDVIKVYGKNDYFRSEQGLNIIGYVDRKNNTSIEFWLIDEKLNFYKLDNKSMK